MGCQLQARLHQAQISALRKLKIIFVFGKHIILRPGLVFTNRIKLILGLTSELNLIQGFGGLTFELNVGGAYF